MTTTTMPPRRILLATDLSNRCDRALDRAAQLALQWQAELVVVHALSAPGLDRYDPLASTDVGLHLREKIAAERILLDLGADLRGNRPPVLSVHVEEADPAELTLRVAREKQCDLIVTGVARDGLFGVVALGSTVDALVRRSPVPVLIVRGRPRGSYAHVVVASDFSESSRHALHTVHQFFPVQPLTVFHSYRAPYEGMAENEEQRQDAAHAMAQAEAEDFLAASSLPVETRQQARLVLENGDPERRLTAYAESQQVDLVVLGSHGRSAIFDVLLGSVAKQALLTLPCDALVVREPRAVK